MAVKAPEPHLIDAAPALSLASLSSSQSLSQSQLLAASLRCSLARSSHNEVLG